MSDNYKKAIDLLDEIVASGRVRNSSGSTTGAGNTSGSTGSGNSSATARESSEDYFTRRRRELGLDANAVDEDYINQFLADAKAYTGSDAADRARMGFGTGLDVYDTRKQTGQDLSSRSYAIRNYLKNNKDYLPEEYYTQLTEYLDNFDQWNAGSLYDYYSSHNIYSQYENEEEYAAARWEQQLTNKYKGKSYVELQEIMGELHPWDDHAELEWLKQYAPTVMTDTDYGVKIGEINTQIYPLERSLGEMTARRDELQRLNTGYARSSTISQEQKDAVAEELEQLNAEIASVEAQLEALNASRWELTNQRKYNTLDDRPDFETGSAVAADGATAGFGIGIGTSWFGKGDPVYDYINDLDGTRQEHKEYSARTNGTSPYSIYDLMSDEEINVYNYLYNTEGKDSAQEYLGYLEYALNERRMGGIQENAQAYANDAGVLASLASVSMNLMSGIGTLDVAGQNFVKGWKENITGEYAGPIDYNRAAMAPAVTSSAIRETRSQYYKDKYGEIALDPQEHPILSRIFNGKSVGDVYQLGMSMVDSAAVAALSPVLGSYGTVLLGGSASTQTILDAVENGATDEQALTMGILSGAFEMLFEKYELEHLLGADSNMLKALVNQALTEGIGEGATTIANSVADFMIMAENSGYQRLVAEYVKNGLSQEEAARQALLDYALQVGWDVVGGMLSGSMMGAVTSPITNAASRNAEAQRIYGSDPGALVAEALELNPGNAFAQRMQGRLDNGKGLTGGQLNRLVQQNESAMNAQDMQDIQDAAAQRLTELGETANVETVAAALARQAAGEKLSKSDRQAIAQSRYGQRVGNELNTENIRSGDYASAWAQNIGTERINAKDYNQELMDLAVETAGASRTSQAAPGQEIKTSEGNLPVGEKGVSYEVSEDGKTTVNGEEVQLGGIRKKEDGSYVVVTGENETADGSDVKFASRGQALVYESYMNLDSVTDNATIRNMNAEARSALATAYNPASNQNGKSYVVGANMVYYYGYEGISPKSLKDNAFAKDLTPEQVNTAYDAGRRRAEADRVIQEQGVAAAYQQAKEIIDSRKNAPKKGGNKAILEGGITEQSMTRQQKASYKLAEAVANAVGTDIHVYLGGKENGRYDGNTGEIWLNINAHNNGQSMMAFTLGHELVHMAKQWSPDKYQAFADFLLEAYGQKGVPVEQLIQDKIDSYKNNGETLTHDQALVEVICDSCQRMLLDSNAVQEMAEFKKEHPDIVQAILDFVKKWLDKIRKAFEGAEPGSMEAEHFKQLDQVAQELAKNLFVDMVMEAGDRMSTIREAHGKGTVVAVDESGAFSLVRYDENSEAVDVSEFTKHSYSSLAEAAGFTAVENDDGTRAFVREGERVQKVTVEDIENSPIGAFINFSLEQKDISKADADRQKKMFADICTMACQTNDFSMTMQFVGSAVFTGMKANADKQYGTTYDFPSICTKTQAVIDAMSAKMVALGRGLNTDEITEIYREVFASGNPVPCPECYVFSRWIGIGGLLDNIKKYQDYYGGMTVAEAADAYRSMRAEIEAFAKEQGLTFGKAKGALTSRLTKEFNKLTEKIEKATNQGETVKDTDRQRLEELEPMMNTVKAMTWLENVYFTDSSLTRVNKNFRVPNEVLFDLNNGEAFATQYREAWAFRTTQGAGYGKAITPYAEARLGEGVLVTNNTTNTIKGKAQGSLNNYFLKQNGKLDSKARDALIRARAKQKNQAFIGGQRFQSTSDARYENASDYLLAALEMQAMHGMVQVYTKVDGAVPALATWGYSINQSLMPLGGGLDADGKVKDTSVGGMNPKVAFANRDKHETAGTITIGVNDNHIRAMFNQRGRDFIIPYHASGGKADVVADFRSIQEGQEKRGKMVRSTDYSRTQSDKILSDEVLRWQGKTQEEIDRIHSLREARIAILTRGKVDMGVVRSNEFLSALYDKLHGGEWDGVKIAKSKVEAQIYPNEFWNQDVSYEESAQITEDYLQYCEDLGFLHRFSGLVPRNGVLVPVTGYDQNGERVQLTDLAYKYDEDGRKTGDIEGFFWKVLTDRRMYDNEGKYLPQKVVTLNDTTVETVTKFAKNNDGRQYDKQKAIELAKKIAGTKYSISEDAVTPTYEELIAKDPVKVVDVGRNEGGLSYAELKKRAKKKAHSEKWFDEPHKNQDTNVMVFLMEDSFTHSFSTLTADFGVDTILAMEHIPEIIHEAILTQIDPPRNPRKAETRVFSFFGAIEGENGIEPVKLTVKEYSGGKPNEMPQRIRRYFEENGMPNTYNRLYDAKALEVVSIEKAKKESGASASVADREARTGAKGTPNSRISVAELLALVNDDARKYIPKPAADTTKNSRSNSNGVSTRELLANAFDGIAQTPAEKQMMQEYRDNISKVNDAQKRLTALRSQISKQTNAGVDAARIAEMNENAKSLAKLIDAYDRTLLKLEASKPLRDVVERARSAAYQKARVKGDERLAAYKEAVSARFDRGVDNRRKTVMRQKVRKVIRDLDKILNRGDKKRNVKEDMKGLVAEALASAEILFIDNYTNEDMVWDGVGTELTPEEARYMEEARALLEQISNLPSGSYEAMMARAEEEAKLKSKLAYRMANLKDVFIRERARLNRTQVSEVLGRLADAYKALESSEYDYVKDAFHENVYQYLLMMKDEVGGTIVKDMSLNQLEQLHKAYTMVLTTVRNANRMFAENLKETRDNLANRVMFEVRKAGGVHGRWWKPLEKANAFSWNNEKPVYAFERIGSATLTTLYRNIRKGQDTWAVDIGEADSFRRALDKKYKRSEWDLEKQYKFTSSSEMEFSLNLEQIMSLYAYSKRDQAHEHLLKGGFVFDGNTEVETKMGIPFTYMNEDATAYNVSDEILGEIISKLTGEQKAFVDEMQDYLSTTMGNKGNSVSIQLYGVNLFNEKFYFPLRSAGQYMERAKEANLQKEQGQISIINSSFSKATTPKASNPVVLSGFMDVWADHVNEMSMYHSFVLPMEDFRRVYNYSSPHMEGQPSVSVNQVIQNAYGAAATAYIDQLYRDLNGGAVTDPRENFAKSMTGKFKKAAVMASASVVFQQPSAIGRAYAMVDPKHFGALPVVRGTARAVSSIVTHKHGQMWEELKKYAPVAVIKEMGYFDTGMGRSAREFLQAEDHNGFWEKFKGFFKDGDYRDEVMGFLPAKADELTWIQIWNAVKKETAARHPKMARNSEEFLKLAGERFSEVIDKTQVYDSVLARSANMRSKGLFMNIATSFMAEPTTTINMLEDAIRQGKKGNKASAARIMGAVFTSVLINSALSALIYAARDDDEDEAWIEKYLSSFFVELIDGINPITMVPFLKDVWSLLQGYDIERADMSLFADLANTLKKLVTAYTEETDGMSAGQLAEHQKKIRDGWLAALDSVASILGTPLKNVRREIMAVINFYNTIKVDSGGRQMTWGSFKDIVGGDIVNSLPVVGWLPDDSKAEILYDAIVSGDEAYAERLRSSYKDEDAVEAALRGAIRERYFAGKIDAGAVLTHLVEYGGLKGDEAFWQLMEWDHKIQYNEDFKKYADFFNAVETGKDLESVIQFYTENGVDIDTLRDQITDHFKPIYLEMSAAEREELRVRIFDAMVETGNSKAEAEDKLYEWDFEAKHGESYEDMVEAFKAGDMSRSEMKKILMERGLDEEEAEFKLNDMEFVIRHGIEYKDREKAFNEGQITEADLRRMYQEKGKTEEEINNLIDAHKWLKAHPEYELNASTVVAYIKPLEGLDYSIEETGMDINTFVRERSKIDKIRGEDGVPNSRIVKAFPYINSLDLTPEQKTALAIACDWSLKTVLRNKLW